MAAVYILHEHTLSAFQRLRPYKSPDTDRRTGFQESRRMAVLGNDAEGIALDQLQNGPLGSQ